jgi:hypothetical protein
VLSGCIPLNPIHAHQYRDPNPHWKEEVALADGSKLMVERSQTFGRNGYLGEGRVIGRRTLDFVNPSDGRNIHWEGDEDAIPILLDFKDGVPYLAATPFSCNSFRRLGNPLPPYALYKYTGLTPAKGDPPLSPPKTTLGVSDEEAQRIMWAPSYQSAGWERIRMADFPEAFAKANLVENGYKMHEVMAEAAYKQAGYVTAALVDKYNGEHKEANRKVLRSGKEGARDCVADQEAGMRGLIYDTQQETWDAQLRKYHPDPEEYAYYQDMLKRLLKQQQEMKWVLDHVKPDGLDEYMKKTYPNLDDRSEHYRVLIEIKQIRQAKEKK